MKWNTTNPPKRTQKPLKLRFQDDRGKISTGTFVWSKSENTWIECVAGDGLGLYESDGYKVLGWREETPVERERERKRSEKYDMAAMLYGH